MISSALPAGGELICALAMDESVNTGKAVRMKPERRGAAVCIGVDWYAQPKEQLVSE
ncbi:MAG: hypothetical protein Q7S40_26535 [Opitutaceae bacterium]|nr:hypothetical protein [Opitutaceae bacterium]